MTHGTSTGGVRLVGGKSQQRTASPQISTGQVWNAIGKASFAILGYVTPAGEPRSSGVVYGVANHRLYTAVAPDSWKARQIADGQQVALTVPVRRGSLLSLLIPIPPATVSFHARAVVHQPGTLDLRTISKKLESLLPADRRDVATILELEPEGIFVTYGIGVSLRAMIDPVKARARVPIA